MKLKIKISKFTIIAICLLIIAGIIFYYEEIKEKSDDINMMSVVVAVKDIKENTVISSEHITIDYRYIEDINKQDNLISEYAAAIGKRTVVPLFKGEAVIKERLIENKPWMNDLDEKQISLNLTENDKAADIIIGDYIDIWIEPKIYGDEEKTLYEAKKIFEKLFVINVLDANYQIKITEDFVPAFVTIHLDDEKLKQFLEIDKTKYNIRITKYGEEQYYKAIEIKVRR